MRTYSNPRTMAQMTVPYVWLFIVSNPRTGLDRAVCFHDAFGAKTASYVAQARIFDGDDGGIYVIERLDDDYLRVIDPRFAEVETIGPRDERWAGLMSGIGGSTDAASA